MRRLKIGLLGCGVVGGGFVRLLDLHRSQIEERAEAKLEVTRIVVRDLAKERPFVDRALLTTRGDEVVRNGVDMVVELIGGIDPARGLIREALGLRKSVVTANKRLLALHGGALFALAETHRVGLGFEASVGGAIPVVRTIQHSLAGDRIRSIRGVLNGTSNFILTRGEEGIGYDDALREAQRLGFAEADASLDVDGDDALQKITILARLAFGDRAIRIRKHSGVRAVRHADHEAAKASGKALRLVAAAAESGDRVDISVGVEAVSAESPIGRTKGVGNVVCIEADASGELVLSGAGAGSLPSAGAVLADVVEIARRQR